MTRALIVIDVQNAVIENAHDRVGVVARIADLVDRARAAGRLVIWVRHADDELVRGSHGWELVDELRPGQNEPVIDKGFGDAFEGTMLQDVLAERGVTGLYVTGAQTDFCVRSTLHGAVTRGHDAVLVRDCHTTDDRVLGPTMIVAADIIAHTNFYWQWHRTVANMGGTVGSDEIDFGGD